MTDHPIEVADSMTTDSPEYRAAIRELRDIAQQERVDGRLWVHQRANQLRRDVGQKVEIWPADIAAVIKAGEQIRHKIAQAVVPVMRKLAKALAEIEQPKNLPVIREALRSAELNGDQLAVRSLTRWVERLESRV